MRIVSILLVCAAIFPWQHALCAGDQSDVGLSKVEAAKIANRFFAQEAGNAEASIMEPHVSGDQWVFPIKVGYAGTVGPAVLVNRFTGQATWVERLPPKQNESEK